MDGGGAVSSPFFYILHRPPVQTERRTPFSRSLRVERRSGDHSHAVGITGTSVAKRTLGPLAVEGFLLMVENGAEVEHVSSIGRDIRMKIGQ